jgi:hypothetical protein
VTVFWFRPQPSGLQFIDCATKPTEVGRPGYVLKSSGLLRVEVSRGRVFQSGLKIVGGAMMGDARGIIVEVMSSGT